MEKRYINNPFQNQPINYETPTHNPLNPSSFFTSVWSVIQICKCQSMCPPNDEGEEIDW